MNTSSFVRQRIYIDTSVMGGYYDVDFETPTRKLFERIENKEFEENDFDTVSFFRNVKEKIAVATNGMTLQERRNWFQNIREGNPDAMKQITEI